MILLFILPVLVIACIPLAFIAIGLTFYRDVLWAHD